MSGMLGYIDLSDDARAAGSMLGAGAVKAFGYETKQDALQRIWENTDWEDEEKAQVALSEIRKIDPNVWAEANKQHMAAETDRLNLLSMKNIPQLEAEWRLKGKELHTSTFAQQYLPGAPANIKTRADMVKYLVGLVRDDTIKNTEKNDYLKSYNSFIKTTEESFYKANKYKDFNNNKGGKSSSSINWDGAGSKDKAKKIASKNMDTYVEETHPDSSKVGLQWEKNKIHREIGDLGTQVSPNPAAQYSAGVPDSIISMPGVDVTFGTANDSITTILNGIVGLIGDGINLFTGTVEGDKLREIAQDASDWYIQGRGHAYFQLHPEDLEKAKKDPLGFYKSLSKKRK